MDLSDGARKAIFCLIVLGLFGLFAWNWIRGSDENAAEAQARATQQQREAADPEPVNTPPPATDDAENEGEDPGEDEGADTGSERTPTVRGQDPDVPDIGALTELEMPVTQADLNDAVEVSDEFMTNYLSYSWDTPAEEWADSVRTYTSSDLYGQTSGGYPDGPLLDKMIEQETHHAADVNVIGIGMLSADSMMLEVAANVVTTTTEGISENTYQNQITLIRMSGGWKVSSVYPTGTGDAGFVDEDTYGYDPGGGLNDTEPGDEPGDEPEPTGEPAGEQEEPTTGQPEEGDGTSP